ncbi:MAG: helix-turn-helix transcriptional regulator [Dialister invisus]|uniref:helix-turn-helix domain-containing protein n=1 Tax=Dialister invisus TaxID=218538 RepID=UPI002F943F9E
MHFKIENFGQKLKEAREKNKISRAQMAKKLNMTPQAYGAYELGKREPPVSKLIDICEFLHISPHDLLGYETDTTDELEQTLLDIKECGFLVFPDNRDQTQAINDRPIHIINEAESTKPGDEAYTIDGQTLITLSKKINSMALNTYRESKHQLYKLAFDEVQKMQIQVIYDKLKTDPDLKSLRDQITKINPRFFDKETIGDEDTTKTNK